MRKMTPIEMLTYMDEQDSYAQALMRAILELPQGVSLARHGALGDTQWCVTNTEDEHESYSGKGPLEAIMAAKPLTDRLKD